MALSISGGKWQLKYDHAVRNLPVLNNSGGALTEGTAVVYSSGTLAAIGDGNTVGISGVLTDNVAASATGTLYPEGVFRVGVSGTIDFALDGAAYSAATGLVDTGSTNDIPVGRVVYGASTHEPASGDAQVDVLMTSLFYHRGLTAHA